MTDRDTDGSLVVSPDDDRLLFVIRLVNRGEELVARYRYRALNGRELRFPMFYDPERPSDHTLRPRVGLNAIPVHRLSYL